MTATLWLRSLDCLRERPNIPDTRLFCTTDTAMRNSRRSGAGFRSPSGVTTGISDKQDTTRRLLCVIALVLGIVYVVAILVGLVDKDDRLGAAEIILLIALLVLATYSVERLRSGHPDSAPAYAISTYVRESSSPRCAPCR
jgi:hypothetical protein